MLGINNREKNFNLFYRSGECNIEELNASKIINTTKTKKNPIQYNEKITYNK
jgi:hypothetical protein